MSDWQWLRYSISLSIILWWPLPVCPCARGSGLCPCARGSGCARVPGPATSPEVQKWHACRQMSLSAGSPNSQSTLRGSYGRCKGRCLIWVLTLVCGIFTCKFPYGVALVTCWSAFPLRRLAQSVCLRSGLIGLPPQHPPPQHQHLPTQHQHHHFPLPWHQLQPTPQYTADVPARNVSIYLSIYLSTYLSIYLFVCLSVNRLQKRDVIAAWARCPSL